MKATAYRIEPSEPVRGCKRAGFAAALEVDSPQRSYDVQRVGPVDLAIAIEVEESRSRRQARKSRDRKVMIAAACRPQYLARHCVDRQQRAATASTCRTVCIEAPVIAARQHDDPFIRALARIRNLEPRDDRLGETPGERIGQRHRPENSRLARQG